MKEKIIELLLSVNRSGMPELINWMEANGFFTAPSSTQHHLCCEGGLAAHSYNVFTTMDDLSMSIDFKNHHKDVDSIVICSLLHDIGKVGQYGKDYYVENYLSKRDKEGNPVRSTAKPYVSNSELLNVPHEVRSISIINRFIELTEEEQ